MQKYRVIKVKYHTNLVSLAQLYFFKTPAWVWVHVLNTIRFMYNTKYVQHNGYRTVLVFTTHWSTRYFFL